MSIPPDSGFPADTPRAWRLHMLDVPPAASRAGVQVARIDFDWHVPLASPAYAALSDAERTRAGRYFRHEDAVRSAGTRAALRDVLGAALGVAPNRIAIVVDASGRPSLDPAHRTSLDFNVSHAGDHALHPEHRASRKRAGYLHQRWRPGPLVSHARARAHA